MLFATGDAGASEAGLSLEGVYAGLATVLELRSRRLYPLALRSFETDPRMLFSPPAGIEKEPEVCVIVGCKQQADFSSKTLLQQTLHAACRPAVAPYLS